MATTIFDFNSRVERIQEGIRFYESDILCCSYLFESDLIIDMKIDYIASGFGIVIAKDNGHSFREADDVYLFRIGTNDFSIIRKHLLEQNTLITNSCVLSSSYNNKNIHLKFSFKDNIASLDWLTLTLSGTEEIFNLGKLKLTDSINRYKIGFYSSAGNIIRETTFLSGVPEHWHTSIKNVRGGRMAFFTDGFRIENCEYDAEIEQQDILLNPGTYYVSYDTETINNKFDIECIVFPTNTEYIEANFEDPNKNLLQKDGSLVVTEDIPSVNIKFKGTNGIIKNIILKDDPDSEFIETEGEVISIPGSWMTIFLDDLTEIRWRGTINTVPQYIDLTKPCPYAVIETVNHRTTLEEANISLKKEYGYIYKVEDSTLLIGDTDYNQFHKNLKIELTTEDNNQINVFHNLNGYIYELIITKKDGTQIDILHQKTYKKYVPADINSPIIVTDEKLEDSFDLSAAYREVVSSKTKISLYPTRYTISIFQDVPFSNLANYKVYAIPKEATINFNATSIDEYASSYVELTSKQYSINSNDVITLDDDIIQRYKYVAVEYTSIEDFTYYFTNYEREVFNDTQSVILLEKDILETSDNVIVYGVLKDANIKSKYLYRVPSMQLINSIDYYTDKYDILEGSSYEIDYDNKEIKIENSVRNNYKAFIIDYLKNDSYAINYIEEYNQYEVDIATSLDMVYVNYNMRENGNIYEYKTTAIRPDSNKYVLLRKEVE